MNPAKTVAALHDLSGVGRCSLTVVIPVISAMGVQVIPAPTAVLSAHTAFPEYVSRDLTDYLEECLNMWSRMHLAFDCVYSGYLASVRQEEIAREFLSSQKDAIHLVDPVMGDDGVMYRALPRDMPQAMRRLCREADVITPNLTEARLLVGEELPGRKLNHPVGANRSHETLSLSYLERLLNDLMALGCRTALITGVTLEDGRHVNAWMDSSGRISMKPFTPIPAGYPGTGDMFASVLAGALTLGRPFEDAVTLAADYVAKTMEVTMQMGTEPVYGVQLETTLPILMEGESSC